MFHSTNTCRPKCDRLFCLLSSSLNAQPFVCLAPLFALYRSCSQGTFLLCLALRQIPFIVTVEQMEESGRFLSRYYVINDWLPTRSAVCSCDRNMSVWCQVFNAEKTELHPAIPGIIIGCKEANVHKGHCPQTRHLNRVQSTNRFSWCTGWLSWHCPTQILRWMMALPLEDIPSTCCQHVASFKSLGPPFSLLRNQVLPAWMSKRCMPHQAN